jgi:hypothetical protein
MGLFQSDVTLYVFLKVAMADLRRNKFLLEQAFEDLANDSLYKDQYGKSEQERIAALLDKQIMVYSGHRPPDTAKYPCFAIKLGGGQEDSGRESLNDYPESEQVDSNSLGGAFPNEKIIAEDLTPISYDKNTGTITFNSATDLDALRVFDGHFILDTVNNKKYPIILVLSSSQLLIDAVQDINLTNLKIVTKDKNYAHSKKTLWYWETHSIECWSTDSVECIYLWNILMYCLIRYKQPLLDNRGFSIGTYSYGPIQQYNPEDPNSLYYREVTLRGRVAHTVITETKPLIGGVNTGVGICGATSPEQLRELLDSQGWSGCRNACDPSDEKPE